MEAERIIGGPKKNNDSVNVIYKKKRSHESHLMECRSGVLLLRLISFFLVATPRLLFCKDRQAKQQHLMTNTTKATVVFPYHAMIA